MWVLFNYFSPLEICIGLDVWFGEDQRTNTLKTHVCLKEIRLCLQSLFTTSHSIVYSIKDSTNMHVS